MATQQRDIREILVIFKRLTHGIVVEIYQTCSDIGKTNAKSQMLKLLKCQKIILKNQKILNLELLKQQKKNNYDYSHYTQKKNIRERSC